MLPTGVGSAGLQLDKDGPGVRVAKVQAGSPADRCVPAVEVRDLLVAIATSEGFRTRLPPGPEPSEPDDEGVAQ